MAATPFTADHEALRAAVARFTAERLRPRAAAWDTDGVPAAITAELVDLGYLGDLGARADGAPDRLADLVVAEELGRSGAFGVTATLLDVAHGAAALLAAARHPASARIGAPRVAFADRDRGAAPTRAVGAGDGWLLEGGKTQVLDGCSAEAALVRAQADDGEALFLVDVAADGWQPRRIAVGSGWRAAEIAEVRLAGVRVPPAGRVDCSAAALTAHRRTVGVLVAAAATAAAWQAFDHAREHALQREAFGRPIGRFQANRHALARAATKLTAARQLVRDAVAGPADAGARAEHGRRYAVRAAAEVVDGCLQLHGGYGYTAEHDVERAWRDSRTTLLLHGDGVDGAAPHGSRRERQAS